MSPTASPPPLAVVGMVGVIMTISSRLFSVLLELRKSAPIIGKDDKNGMPDCVFDFELVYTPPMTAVSPLLRTSCVCRLRVEDDDELELADGKASLLVMVSTIPTVPSAVTCGVTLRV